MTTETSNAEKKVPDLNDYLEAGKKKRKNHILICYSAKIPKYIPPAIEGFLKNKFPDYVVLYPRNKNEFAKSFIKQISFIIIDDNFDTLDKSLQMILKVKQSDQNTRIPVLFLTNRPTELVAKYQQYLSLYHEIDDYYDYNNTQTKYLFSKLFIGLNNRNRRKSRRYKLNVNLTFKSLTLSNEYDGTIEDLSLHGALLRCRDNKKTFLSNEQLHINLPIPNMIKDGQGEFLKLSAKVQRIHISGNLAGVKFEYISEHQIMLLTEYLTDLAFSQVKK